MLLWWLCRPFSRTILGSLESSWTKVPAGPTPCSSPPTPTKGWVNQNMVICGDAWHQPWDLRTQGFWNLKLSPLPRLPSPTSHLLFHQQAKPSTTSIHLTTFWRFSGPDCEGAMPRPIQAECPSGGRAKASSPHLASRQLPQLQHLEQRSCCIRTSSPLAHGSGLLFLSPPGPQMELTLWEGRRQVACAALFPPRPSMPPPSLLVCSGRCPG